MNNLNHKLFSTRGSFKWAALYLIAFWSFPDIFWEYCGFPYELYSPAELWWNNAGDAAGVPEVSSEGEYSSYSYSS